MLNRNGESRHPYLILNFRGEVFSFPPLILFVMGLRYIAFIYSCITFPFTIFKSLRKTEIELLFQTDKGHFQNKQKQTNNINTEHKTYIANSTFNDEILMLSP